jgi:glyoxylase-like metal-dependent hydrolase (beta-lactamase superfamily II)
MREKNVAPQRDSGDVAHRDEPKPEWKSKANAGASFADRLQQIGGEVHLQSGVMRRTCLIAAFVFAATSATAQEDFSNVEIKATRVAGTVYMLTGAGGNIGVSAGDDGIVIVDDQYAPLAPKIKEALKAISTKPLKFIINTHYHGDHVGGNEVFGAEAPIVAHESVRKRLQNGANTFGRVVPPSPKVALPVVTFNDRVTLHVNGEDIRALHVQNGHTDGDSVIIFPQSNVVHMGDDFFNGRFPVVDLANGGSVKGMLAAIEGLLPTFADDVKIIPGHGPLGDKKSLRAFADMLKGTLAAVETEVKAGKTLDEMKKGNILGPWMETWGKGAGTADRYLGIVFEELSRK